MTQKKCHSQSSVVAACVREAKLQEREQLLGGGQKRRGDDIEGKRMKGRIDAPGQKTATSPSVVGGHGISRGEV